MIDFAESRSAARAQGRETAWPACGRRGGPWPARDGAGSFVDAQLTARLPPPTVL